MPAARGQPGPGDPPSFPEAIAQWRLDLRTAVKATSSLPSAVFHSRDAMLEAHLAEATEDMLARLLEPPPALHEPQPAGERRIETVGADELRALPGRLRGDGEPPVGLDDCLVAESLAVLADASTTGNGAAAAAAAALLRDRFGIAPGSTPAAVAAQLAALLPSAGDEQALAAAAAAVCQHLAATPSDGGAA
jgi:hypothetical protein